MPRKFALWIAAAALGVLPVFAGVAHAAAARAACGESAYSYAGIIGRQATRGVMATVEMTAGPAITRGHVGAWVGVGGSGLGPGGTDEWLQVGLATTDSSAATHVYYELTKPYGEPRFVSLAGSVAVGQLHRLGVIEMLARPNWWRVWLDGRPVTKPIFLPSSHARFVPVATSESWNGGVTSCNTFGYRFRNIRWSASSRALWRPLQNAYSIDAPGYSVRRTASAGMVVAGGTTPAPADSPTPQLGPPVVTD